MITISTSTTPRLGDTTICNVEHVETGNCLSYAFLEDGALVIHSPNGTPMTGSWAVSDDGKLSMTEEGITYPTDLVVHDAEHITLRSHNPAGVVEIALVRAPAVPLPTATAPAA